ncbi:DUF883 family protein [Gynuella sunshinyii]|nr:DUF883 family protein [Gynuella sunshinyii]
MTTQSNSTENSGNGKNIDRNKSSGAGSIVSNELNKLLADIEDLVKATNILTGEELSKAKAELSERIAAAKVSAEDVGSKMAHRASKTARITNSYVHDQPWQVIGGGALVGFLMGYLLARRN